MKRLWKNEKVRFLFVGCFNTGLDFLLLNIMVFIFGAYPLAANAVSVSIGITISYILNHYIVFQQPSRPKLKKYLGFFAVTGFSSLIIQTLVISGAVALFNSPFSHSLVLLNLVSGHEFWELNIAKAAAVLIGMVWNFTLYKFVIFKKDPPTDAELLEKSVV